MGAAARSRPGLRASRDPVALLQHTRGQCHRSGRLRGRRRWRHVVHATSAAGRLGTLAVAWRILHARPPSLRRERLPGERGGLPAWNRRRAVALIGRRTRRLARLPVLRPWLSGPPGGAINADGRTEVFAATVENTISHAWMLRPEGVDFSWSDFTYFTGPIELSPPSFVQNSDGRLEGVFAGLNGTVEHCTQTAANGPWVVQGALGGTTSCPPVITRNGNGHLEIFHVDPQGALHNNWQLATAGPFSGPNPMDAPHVKAGARICVARNPDRRLELFAVTDTGDVVHGWQSRPGAGPWNFEPLLGRPGGGAAELGIRDAWGMTSFD